MRLRSPEFAEIVKLAWDRMAQCLAPLEQAFNNFVQRIASLSPSVGYEPLLIDRGVHWIWARGLSRIVVRWGAHTASVSKRRPAIVRAIRLLAKPNRRRASALRNARILLVAWAKRKSSAIYLRTRISRRRSLSVCSVLSPTGTRLRPNA